MLTYKKKRDGIAGFGLVGISFIFFQFFYPYHLFFKEQMQLFLYTSDYFLSYFNKPAWLARYIGDFLTQFFYLRGGGATVLAIIFLLEWILCLTVIKRVTNTVKASLWALIPAGIDFVLHSGLLYNLSFSVGFILMLCLFLIYTPLSNRWLSFIAGLGITLIGYRMIGSLIFIFPVVLFAYDRQKKRGFLLKWLLIVIADLLIPFSFRNSYLLTRKQSFIFPAFDIKSMLLPVSLVLVILAVFSLKKAESQHPLIINSSVLFILLLLLTGGINRNADFHLEKILSLDGETYFGNTDRVIMLSKKYNMKDRRATYFTNIALAKKGIFPDSLLNYYQPASYSLILPVAPGESWMSIVFSSEVFYLVGDMNMAQHAAMLGNTFSPGQRSSRLVKRLAEINMVNGDTAAAGKYLRILSKTLFYKRWAATRQKINHASATAGWLLEKRKQIARADTLLKANDYLSSLNFLVEQNPDNLVALDYLMCFYLLNKDLRSFRKMYDRYGRFIHRPVPSIYNEALLIELFAEQSSREEVLAYAISPRKTADFITYTRLYDQTKGDMNTLKEPFGKSYWFYYHFATLKKNCPQ